ncbi:transcriptional regulatory protein LnrK [Deinococcus carri]|uniref:Transcriptional regulatory protein LnrK n=1 Tax=Deinococcus carri TaxID=1211323 RepID=A0ABP9W529_9DEIO
MSPSSTARVMILARQTLLRQGLRRALTSAGFQVVADVADGPAGVRHAAHLRPDVILPDPGGVAGPEPSLLVALLCAAPHSRVIALTDGPGAAPGRDPVCLPKTADLRTLAALIRGDSLPEDPPAPPPPTGTAPALGEGDRALLTLLAYGLSNRQIAAHLHVSEKTVRNRLTQTFARLRVHNRTQAAVYALRAGIAHL